MKRLLFVIVMLAGLIWGGGCSEDVGFECFSDLQCSTGVLCIEGSCLASCSQDEDCSEATSCEVFQRPGESDPVLACLATENEDGLACVSDRSCKEFFADDRAYCGIHGYCVHPGDGDLDGDGDGDGDGDSVGDGDGNADGGEEADELFYVVIEQLTDQGEVYESALPEADAEGDSGGEDDPEFELQEPLMPVRVGALVLRNEQQSAVGYGEILQVEGHPEAGGALMTEVLSLNEEGTCTDDEPGAPYLSLGGPGGRAYLSFYERPGQVVIPGLFWRMEVLAEGAECLLVEEAGGVEDTGYGLYRVLVCRSKEGSPTTDEECFYEGGPYQGYSDLEVTSDLGTGI